MSIYGHRQLNLFFFPLVETMEHGFRYKKIMYSWRHIKEIRIWDEPYPPYFRVIETERVSKADIELSDNKHIKINGREFEKKDNLLNEGFITAFDEFIALFKEKKKQLDAK